MTRLAALKNQLKGLTTHKSPSVINETNGSVISSVVSPTVDAEEEVGVGVGGDTASSLRTVADDVATVS